MKKIVWFLIVALSLSVGCQPAPTATTVTPTPVPPTATAIPPTSIPVPPTATVILPTVTPTPESHGIEIGVKAPDFSLTDATGKTVNLAGEVSKHKSVVLVFYGGQW